MDQSDNIIEYNCDKCGVFISNNTYCTECGEINMDKEYDNYYNSGEAYKNYIGTLNKEELEEYIKLQAYIDNMHKQIQDRNDPNEINWWKENEKKF